MQFLAHLHDVHAGHTELGLTPDLWRLYLRSLFIEIIGLVLPEDRKVILRLFENLDPTVKPSSHYPPLTASAQEYLSEQHNRARGRFEDPISAMAQITFSSHWVTQSNETGLKRLLSQLPGIKLGFCAPSDLSSLEGGDEGEEEEEEEAAVTPPNRRRRGSPATEDPGSGSNQAMPGRRRSCRRPSAALAAAAAAEDAGEEAELPPRIRRARSRKPATRHAPSSATRPRRAPRLVAHGGEKVSESSDPNSSDVSFVVSDDEVEEEGSEGKGRPRLSRKRGKKCSAAGSGAGKKGGTTGSGAGEHPIRSPTGDGPSLRVRSGRQAGVSGRTEAGGRLLRRQADDDGREVEGLGAGQWEEEEEAGLQDDVEEPTAVRFGGGVADVHKRRHPFAVISEEEEEGGEIAGTSQPGGADRARAWPQRSEHSEEEEEEEAGAGLPDSAERAQAGPQHTEHSEEEQLHERHVHSDGEWSEWSKGGRRHLVHYAEHWKDKCGLCNRQRSRRHQLVRCEGRPVIMLCDVRQSSLATQPFHFLYCVTAH